MEQVTAGGDTTLGAVDPLDEPRAAVGRGDWHAALAGLAKAGADADTAEGLELRAQALYGAGEFEACVTAWEQLHSQLSEGGDRAGAARSAAMIAMYLMMDTGLMAPVRGWLRRADHLLGGADESPAHALVAMVRTYERFMCGDMDAARANAAAAVELGDRQGVLPATVIGRVASARIAIFDGRFDEGLGLLDEVGAALMAGRYDPLSTGMMYCELICAAQGLALYDRAREWTDVMERWRHGVAFGGINGRCRVHRAEMLRVSGPCDVAEEEALAACAELRPWMRREFGWPLVELGTIRLRKGDLEGAEAAFDEAHRHAWSPHPGLALVRLERDDVEGAAGLIAEAVEHPFDIPSKERPPHGDLRLAPLLDAQSEIAFAAGDTAVAERAAAALRAIATTFPSPWLGASASLAEARAAVLAGNITTAVTKATEAVEVWVDIGAPFEACTARLVLGEAHHRAGRRESARREWEAARWGFAEFGAIRAAERAARRVGDVQSDVAPIPAGPAVGTGTFRAEAGTRTVAFAGRSVTLGDLKGLRYVERLLAHPGREFHVLDLVAFERGADVSRRGTPDDGLESAWGVGAGLPVLDDTARDAYRRRLAEVDDDIEEARRANDLGRLDLAERDRDYLVAELQRAVGLGGRTRTSGGSAERARTAVTRSIRYALDRLGEHHPDVAAHLRQRVRTGTYCVYVPDPLAPATWTTG